MSLILKFDIKLISEKLEINIDFLKHFLWHNQIKSKYNRPKFISKKDFTKIISTILIGIRNNFKMEAVFQELIPTNSIYLQIKEKKLQIKDILVETKKNEEIILDLNGLKKDRIKFLILKANIESKYLKNNQIFLKFDSDYINIKDQIKRINKNIDFVENNDVGLIIENLKSKVEILKKEKKLLETKKKDLLRSFRSISFSQIDLNDKMIKLIEYAVEFIPDKIEILIEKSQNEEIIKVKKKLIRFEKTPSISSPKQKSKLSQKFKPFQKGKYFKGKEYYDSTKDSVFAIFIPTGGKVK